MSTGSRRTLSSPIAILACAYLQLGLRLSPTVLVLAVSLVPCVAVCSSASASPSPQLQKVTLVTSDETDVPVYADYQSLSAAVRIDREYGDWGKVLASALTQMEVAGRRFYVRSGGIGEVISTSDEGKQVKLLKAQRVLRLGSDAIYWTDGAGPPPFHLHLPDVVWVRHVYVFPYFDTAPSGGTEPRNPPRTADEKSSPNSDAEPTLDPRCGGWKDCDLPEETGSPSSGYDSNDRCHGWKDCD
jgi:hypothetical protein